MLAQVKSIKSQEELREEIIQKAWQDDKFRQEFIQDPKAALEKYFRVFVPNHVTLNVVEETEEQYYFVLPGKPKLPKTNVYQWS